MARRFNFNPGPATLPLPALEEAHRELLDYQGTGMSMLETSHRSPEFAAVHAEAKALLTELLDIPDTHEVLFCGGGASLQFAMLAMNLHGDGIPAYINTGTWSTKAIKEAKTICGDAKVVASSEDTGFDRIPAIGSYDVPANTAYLHITTNNTIKGTQFHAFPDTGSVPLVADMSSDILSRPLDVSKFGLIYAGAQKNLGPAGVTMLIIRKDLAARCPANVPTMLRYETYLKKDSMFNTPPTFPIYITMLTSRWVKAQGGVAEMQRRNQYKGDLLYGLIDERSDFFTGTAQKDSRSLMNVTLRLPNEDLEKQFIAEAAASGFAALKGHRSVGGIRVSMYNAMPVEGIEQLVAFMRGFADANG